jgi:lipopolysaccharide transport system ATP-binding protein
MSSTAIYAENLGKRYRIGSKGESYKTFRESLARLATLPARAVRQAWRGGWSRNSSSNCIWALQDASFQINEGDVVGVIGRNGAGKSTLLKILSRITEPTAGYADIQGRVGSLLEVGTGFHPELTGGENIFLNGAILGMGRSEISRKFDEIVAFAEVERFIHTPVKHYSSGMYLRLAFAVAAHLEPEILLVDEVLAVGDVAFQKKCLGRMDAVARQGRTVLFVSHNMGAIRSLCNKGLFLQDGRVVEVGDLNSCITRYFRSIGALDSAAAGAPCGLSQEGFGLVQLDGMGGNTVEQGREFALSTTLRIDREPNGFSLFCILEDMHGRQIIHLREESHLLGVAAVEPGEFRISVRFPALWLNPGLYAVHFKVQFCGRRASSRHVSDKFPLDVVGANSMAESLLHPDADWSVCPLESSTGSEACPLETR